MQLFFSCKKKQEEEVVNIETPAIINEDIKTNTQVEKKENSEVVKKDRVDDIFAYKSSYKKVLPEDFLIGKLEDIDTNDYKTRLVLTTLKDFFQELNRGDFNKKYIHKNSFNLLNTTFEYYIEQNAIPDLYRIGKIKWTNSNKGATVSMRFYLGDGITDGQVILEESYVDNNRVWLISDIQTDFMNLFQKYSKDNEQFEPSAYNFYSWE